MEKSQRRPASFSTPLPGATLYHPGSKVILVLILTPFLATSITGAIFVAERAVIPLWLPATLVGWALLAPVFWLALKTVRTSPWGIATGHPWQTWREIPWADVSGVARRGARLRVISKEGQRIGFTPALLFRGAELREALLLSVAPGVVQGTLAEELRRVIITAAPPDAKPQATELPGILRIRPRVRLRLGAALATLVPLGAGGLAVVALPLVYGLPLAALGVLCAVPGIIAFAWLSQLVTLSDAGISVRAVPSGRARGMQWSEVIVLESTPQWSAIRLTGTERVPCPGPGVMRPLDARVYRMFIQRRLRDREHGVLEARRHWLF